MQLGQRYFHQLTRSPSCWTTRKASQSVDFQYVVIGAGVVGLAIGARLAKLGPTLVLEKNEKCGLETSSRNSEVIHAGLYYPEDSLKTKLCIEGNRLLYEYAALKGIPHKKLGKLVVGQTPPDLLYLEKLVAKAQALGVSATLLDKQAVAKLEPMVKANFALFSPSTGIIDSHELIQALQAEIEHSGGIISCRSSVTTLEKTPHQTFVIGVSGEGQSSLISTSSVVNSAGLWAQSIASLLFPQESIPKLYPCKGQYYSFTGPALCSHLVYPIPEPNLLGLGLHTTLDLSGRMKFGPDAWYVDSRNDYSLDESRTRTAATFLPSYLPSLEKTTFRAEYTGIRPKLSGPGAPAADFVIRTDCPGFVNLFGIESPGLTASLAIARRVESLLLRGQ